MTLPLNVVEEDHALEKSSEGAARALITLRWHWTLDESNPDRVSIRQYARDVDRHERWVRRDAHAAEILQSAAGASRTPNEARELAVMGTETAAAAEAVAEAHGIALQTARKEHAEEVRTVRDTARQTAEEQGTTTAEALPKVAAMHKRMVAADKKGKEVSRKNHTMRYIRMEARLSKARRHLMGALQESDGVEFDGEERELLQDTIANVRKLLSLLDRAIADKYDQTWKTELQVLQGGKSA